MKRYNLWCLNNKLQEDEMPGIGEWVRHADHLFDKSADGALIMEQSAVIAMHESEIKRLREQNERMSAVLKDIRLSLELIHDTDSPLKGTMALDVMDGYLGNYNFKIQQALSDNGRRHEKA